MQNNFHDKNFLEKEKLKLIPMLFMMDGSWQQNVKSIHLLSHFNAINYNVKKISSSTKKNILIKKIFIYN